MRKLWQFLTGHWKWFVIYFSVITAFRVLGGKLRLDLINWWLGGLFGMSFIVLDRVAYVYFTRPHEQLSIQVKDLFQKGRYVAGLRLIQARQEEQQHLSLRSVLFAAAWIPLALFVLTSSGNLLASGLVMGLGLHLLFDMLADLNQIYKLKTWLFWPVKRAVTDQETRIVVGVFGLMFLLLSLILI